MLCYTTYDVIISESVFGCYPPPNPSMTATRQPNPPPFFLKCCTLNPRVGFSIIIACEAENHTRLDYEWQRTETPPPAAAAAAELPGNISQEDDAKMQSLQSSSSVPEMSWTIVSKEQVIILIQRKRE